jgi:hypothetical protein
MKRQEQNEVNSLSKKLKMLDNSMLIG